MNLNWSTNILWYSTLQFFLYSSFSLFVLLFVFFFRFLCLYLCSCSPCTVLPLFVRSLPQFVPVFLSWSALFLVQWLLKKELWSCCWRRSITISPFVSLFCFFFSSSPVSPPGFLCSSTSPLFFSSFYSQIMASNPTIETTLSLYSRNGSWGRRWRRRWIASKNDWNGFKPLLQKRFMRKKAKEAMNSFWKRCRLCDGNSHFKFGYWSSETL